MSDWNTIDWKAKKMQKRAEKKREEEERRKAQFEAEAREELIRKKVIERNQNTYQVAAGMESETIYSAFERLEEESKIVRENIVKAKEEKLRKKEQNEAMMQLEAKNKSKKKAKDSSPATSTKKRAPFATVASSIDDKTVQKLSGTATAFQAQYTDKLLLLKAFAGELEELFDKVDPSEEVFVVRKGDLLTQLEVPRSALPGKLVQFVVDYWMDKSLLHQADAKVADDAAGFLLHALVQSQTSRVGIRLLLQALATRRPLALVKRINDIKSRYTSESKHGVVPQQQVAEHLLYFGGQLLRAGKSSAVGSLPALTYWFEIFGAAAVYTGDITYINFLEKALALPASESKQIQALHVAQPVLAKFLDLLLLPDKPHHGNVTKKLIPMLSGLLTQTVSRTEYLATLFDYTVYEAPYVMETITRLMLKDPQGAVSWWSAHYTERVPQSNNVLLYISSQLPKPRARNAEWRSFVMALSPAVSSFLTLNKSLLAAKNKKKKGFTREEIELCDAACNKLASELGVTASGNRRGGDGGGPGFCGAIITIILVVAFVVAGLFWARSSGLLAGEGEVPRTILNVVNAIEETYVTHAQPHVRIACEKADAMLKDAKPVVIASYKASEQFVRQKVVPEALRVYDIVKSFVQEKIEQFTLTSK